MLRFFNEDTGFEFKNKVLCRKWLKTVLDSEVRKMGDISVIFCSDAYILDVNIRYLGHDYFTDIITFDYCRADVVSGDLFISVDSVRENSVIYGTSFSDELHRVIVHGVLHLVGYDDHSEEDQKVMRSKEDYYLGVLKALQV